MYIVYDQTWKRNLWYGRFHDELFLRDAGDGPVSVFRTRKSAEAAIDATTNFEAPHYRPEWTQNSYIILPVKLERKK